MKHNIDGLIITNNQGLRTAVTNLFNSIDNNLLWAEEDELIEVDGNDYNKVPTGFKAVKLHICFNAENERDTVLASLHGLQGIFNNCEENSYYMSTLSDHDLSVKDRTTITKGTKRLNKYGKDSIGKYSESFINNISQGRQYN
jgi:hypothetical protein